MSEATEHEALFDFLSRMEGRYPLLARVFHVPNEADGAGQKVRRPFIRRDGTQGWRAVPLETLRGPARGIKPGVHDIWAPFSNRAAVWGYPAGLFVGLTIEMKSAQGRLTPDQQAWREFLRLEGWGFMECRDWTAAARLLVCWVGGDPAACGLAEPAAGGGG